MTPNEPIRIIAASLHGIDVLDGGRTLRLTGTCRRPGTSGPEPADHDIVLIWRSSGRELEVVTRPRLRFEDGAYRWTGFEGDVPIGDLPTGLRGLDIELRPADGSAPDRATVNAAAGVLATSRVVTSSGRRFQVLPASGTDQVEALVAPNTFAGRFAFRRAVVTRWAKDVLHRRPYAWVQPLRVLTRPFVGRRPVWLVGERADTARDNGFHLFTHLRRERPDIRAYYVLDESSEQFASLAQLGRVVRHSSWRHRILMVHATVLANAYSVKHMVPRSWKHDHYMRQLAWRTGAYRVYLKHGVNVNTKELRRRTGGYDLYLTTSPAETEAAALSSGYGPQLVETGLPRFDALTPTPPSRTIFFMPTWRKYLVPKLFADGGQGQVEFEGSTYQRFVLDLLASPRLAGMLERHDVRLQFMPHYNLRAHLNDVPVGSPRIDVLDATASDIQDVMRRCDLFVTDHSSVHFDIAYLGTPMVYAHFDAADYAAGHAEASWFDHVRDGFGPVTYDLDTTIDALERYLDAACVREARYDERARAAFTFHDQDNSRRVVAAIEDLVRTRGIG